MRQIHEPITRQRAKQPTNQPNKHNTATSESSASIQNGMLRNLHQILLKTISSVGPMTGQCRPTIARDHTDTKGLLRSCPCVPASTRTATQCEGELGCNKWAFCTHCPLVSTCCMLGATLVTPTSKTSFFRNLGIIWCYAQIHQPEQCIWGVKTSVIIGCWDIQLSVQLLFQQNISVHFSICNKLNVKHSTLSIHALYHWWEMGSWNTSINPNPVKARWMALYLLLFGCLFLLVFKCVPVCLFAIFMGISLWQ